MYIINNIVKFILSFISIISIFIIGIIIKSSNTIILKVIMGAILIVVLNELLQILITNNNNKIINFIKNIMDKGAGIFLFIVMHITSYGLGFIMMA